MDVYIKELKMKKSLYLYDPEDESEFSEEFIRIFSDNGLSELSSEEQRQFDTNAKMVMSKDIYNMWASILKRQQEILDSAYDMHIEKTKFPLLGVHSLI